MVLAHPGAVRTCPAAGPVWGGWADDGMSISGQFILPHFEAGGVRAAVNSPGHGACLRNGKGAVRQPFCHTLLTGSHSCTYLLMSKQLPKPLCALLGAITPLLPRDIPLPSHQAAAAVISRYQRQTLSCSSQGAKIPCLVLLNEFNSTALVGPGVPCAPVVHHLGEEAPGVSKLAASFHFSKLNTSLGIAFL